MLEHYPNKGIDMTLHEIGKETYGRDKNLRRAVKIANDMAKAGFTEEDFLPLTAAIKRAAKLVP
jgi:uncharacterized protein YdaT